MVFDSPETSQGLAMLRVMVWFKDYAEVYGTVTRAQEAGCQYFLAS